MGAAVAAPSVIIVALILRGGGESLVREHWPSPGKSLALVLRLAS